MQTNSNKKDIDSQFSEYQQQFLLEYFKEMRAEVNLRIKNHSSLVWAKIVSTGVIVSFLLAQNIDPKIKISGLALVPIIAILYDIMIAQNIKAIHRIGHFIRDQLENVVFPDIELWEHYAGQKNIRERNYGAVDIFLLVTFTFGTMLLTFYLLWIQGERNLALLFGVISLVVTGWLIGFMRKYILFFETSKSPNSVEGSRDVKNA